MAKSLPDDCLEQDKFELLAQWGKEKNGGLSPRDEAARYIPPKLKNTNKSAMRISWP